MANPIVEDSIHGMVDRGNIAILHAMPLERTCVGTLEISPSSRHSKLCHRIQRNHKNVSYGSDEPFESTGIILTKSVIYNHRSVYLAAMDISNIHCF